MTYHYLRGTVLLLSLYAALMASTIVSGLI